MWVAQPYCSFFTQRGKQRSQSPKSQWVTRSFTVVYSHVLNYFLPGKPSETVQIYSISRGQNELPPSAYATWSSTFNPFTQPLLLTISKMVPTIRIPPMIPRHTYRKLKKGASESSVLNMSCSSWLDESSSLRWSKAQVSNTIWKE